MEGTGQDQVEMTTTTMSPGGTPATSRWNPTKEQITMLENLYRQGIRTPTAEQIQEITARLQAYGHIEGKNVFYWFQNHKARQRQKQKQENRFAAYGFHRYLHHQPVPPLFPPPPHPPCPNVVCGSYYMPQHDLGFYPHHYPKVVVPASGMIKKRSQRPNQLGINPGPSNGCIGGLYNNFVTSHPGYYSTLKEQLINDKHQQRDDQETLDLFPMHPTGILQARTDPTHNFSTSFETTSNTAICMNNVEEEGSGTDQLYFDFFSGN